MGFFKKIFFKEEEEKSKIEEEVMKKAGDYSHALTENSIVCNGCGTYIEGKPRVRQHMGKIMYFHKRCWKQLKSGQLPTPLENNSQNEQSQS